jgi:hypothetical protein
MLGFSPLGALPLGAAFAVVEPIAAVTQTKLARPAFGISINPIGGLIETPAVPRLGAPARGGAVTLTARAGRLQTTTAAKSGGPLIRAR